MEERETYSSLQEFTEEPTPEGNALMERRNGSQGPKRAVECLKRQTGLLILIGLLTSICANIALTVLLIQRPGPGAPPQGWSMKSLQKRYIQLCENYTTLSLNCSKPAVKPCRECPEGWIHVGDQCYYFSKDKLDWNKSRESCEEMGSHLTILHTIEEHDALEKEAKRIGGFDYVFWIGLSDIEKEGDWRWVDNSSLQHSYWDQLNSEPDNHQSGGEHGEDCAVLNSHSRTWFDVPCDFLYKRICQMKAMWLS